MKNLLVAIMVLMPLFASAETLIVRFKEGSTSMLAMQTLSKARATVMQGKILIVEGNFENYKANPEVLYVEKNIKYHIMGFQAKMDIPKAWGIGKIQAAKYCS